MPADPEKGSYQTALRLIETLRLLPRYCPATAGPSVSKRGAIPARNNPPPTEQQWKIKEFLHHQS